MEAIIPIAVIVAILIAGVVLLRKPASTGGAGGKGGARGRSGADKH